MNNRYRLPDMETSSPYNMSPYENEPCEAPYREIGVMPEVGGTMMSKVEYPEIYYKVQPFVMSVCDQIGRHYMPTQEELLDISDDIYDNVCHMYPDLEEYAHEHRDMMKSSVETLQRDWDRRDHFNGRFRRRGIFRDFIDILLLNELFRRGGFWW